MKIKIVSDGTRYGTKVLNAETGELVERVLFIEWKAAAGETPIAIIECYTDVELVGDAVVIEKTLKFPKVDSKDDNSN